MKNMLLPCWTIKTFKWLFSPIFPPFCCLGAEMRMTCRCCPCQTSDWWCWRSPSPTCPLTPCIPRRTETTLTPLSFSSPFRPLCPTRAPESHHRYKVKDDNQKPSVVWISDCADVVCSIDWLHADEMPSQHQWLPGWMWPGEPDEEEH